MASTSAHDVLERISEGFVALDREWRVTYVNREATEHLTRLGRARDEVMGKNFWEACPEVVGTQAHQELQRALREGVVVEFELHHPPLDRWFACRAYPNAEGVQCYFRDVTDRKQAEERLKHSDHLFSELGENLTDVLWVAAPQEQRLFYVSRAYEEVWGRTRESVYARHESFIDAIHPEDRERVILALGRQTLGERTEETYRVVRPDGSIRWVLDRAFPVRDQAGQVSRIVGIARDITERRETEERLLLQARVLDSMREGVSVSDEQGAILYVNPAEEAMFGYERGELLGQHVTVQNAYPPEENQRIVGEVIEHLKRHGVWSGEWLNRKKDGSTFTTQAQITAFQADGTQYWVCVQEDVTERRRAEESFRESTERLSLALEVANLGVWHWDTASDRATFSARASEIFGLPPEDHLTRTKLQDFFHPEDRELVRLAVEQAVAQRTAYEAEYRLIRPDGEERWVASKGRGVYDLAGNLLGMRGVVQDITDRKQAETALRLSEERYRTLLAATTAVVWTADAEGRFLEPQPGWQAYTGQTWEEHQGFGWSEAIHPDDREQLLQEWRQAVATASVCEAESRVRHGSSGQYRYFSVRAVPLLDRNGCVREWVGTVTDIHERRMAEAQLREETHTVETINRIGQVLAGELDLQRLLQALTDAATEISDAEFGSFFYQTVGTGGDEALMRYTLSGAPPEAFAEFPLPRATAIFAPTLGEARVLRLHDVTQDPRFGKNSPHHGLPAGHLPLRSYLAVPVVSRTGEVLGALFFGHSQAGVFTERHERTLMAIAAQAAIAIDNARLYKAAKDAAYSAERHARELAEVNRRKDEFISMLSHELRNPLAAVSNAVGVLQQLGPQEERLVRLRGVIARQTHNLIRIVNDLLDVSRLIHGRVELQKERVDLTAVVTRAVDACRDAIDARGHQFSSTIPLEPVTLEADATRLEQIVCNLLDNAAKYTEPEGAISLSIEREESGGNSWAVLRVKDTGVGIPPELLPKVFELFTQADRSLDRAQGGLGIGLTVVLRLVELHGGTIQAFSEGPGKGSEFVLRLPATTPVRRAQAPQTPSAEGSLPALRVLVVDDLVDAAETLGELLEAWGLEVQVAHSGPHALEIVAQFQPDVVLLDLGLPGWDGFEVARRLQELPDSGRMRIVALTGYGQAEDVRRTAEAGFAAHLTKPVDIPALQQLIASIPAGVPRQPDGQQGRL